MPLLSQGIKDRLSKPPTFVEQHKVISAAIAAGLVVTGIFGVGIKHTVGVSVPVPWGDLAIATPLLALGLAILLYLAIAAATGASPNARRRIDVEASPEFWLSNPLESPGLLPSRNRMQHVAVPGTSEKPAVADSGEHGRRRCES